MSYLEQAELLSSCRTDTHASGKVRHMQQICIRQQPAQHMLTPQLPRTCTCCSLANVLHYPKPLTRNGSHAGGLHDICPHKAAELSTTLSKRTQEVG